MENQQFDDSGASLPGPVQADDERSRFERWAWPALIWLAVLGAAAALLAGGTWLYESGQREQTLALLARSAVTATRPAMDLSAFAPPVSALPEPAVELPLPPPAPLPLRKTSRPPTASRRPNQLSETLRQCRMAGYHAAQCLQRGCAATRHGLACRG